MTKKILINYLVKLLMLLFVLSLGASFYFFHVAQVRSEKSFLNNKPTAKTDPLYEYEKAFEGLDKQTLEMTNGGLKQVAWYVPAKEKNRQDSCGSSWFWQ